MIPAQSDYLMQDLADDDAEFPGIKKFTNHKKAFYPPLELLRFITPFGVETIAIPNPLLILGKLSALENILLPGFDTLSKVLITGLPE